MIGHKVRQDNPSKTHWTNTQRIWRRPPHLATVGRQAPAFFCFYFVILIVIFPQIVDRHVYSMICVIITVSELNSSLAFFVIHQDYRSYSRSFHLYLSFCFIFIFFESQFPFCYIASYNTFSLVKFMSFGLVMFMSC